MFILNTPHGTAARPPARDQPVLCVRVVIKVGVRVPEIKVLQYRFQYHLPIPLVCNQENAQYRYDTGKYATLVLNVLR